MGMFHITLKKHNGRGRVKVVVILHETAILTDISVY